MVKELDDTILSICAGPLTVLYLLPLLKVPIPTWSTQNKKGVEKSTVISSAFFMCIY